MNSYLFHKTQMYYKMSVMCHIIYWESLQYIIQTTNTRITLRTPKSTVFFINETQPDKVSKVVEDLNTNKPIDIFGISSKLVNIGAYHLKNMLTSGYIFNYSVSEVLFPDISKRSFIYPIHKGQSEMVCSNYRPISILSGFSKILDELIH